MNAQRSLGLALVVLQATVLAYGFRTYAFSATVVLVAVVGALSRLRLASPEVAARRWPLLLAVLFLVQRTAMPVGWYAGTSGFLFPRSCLIAEYFLVYQVGQFFVRREGDRLPSYLPILAVVTLTFGTDVQVSSQGRLVVQTLIVLCVGAMAGFLAACRWRYGVDSATPARGPRILLAGVLVASSAIGWVAASSLNRYARDIEMALGAVLHRAGRADTAGFSGQGRLGSVARGKGTASDRIALRVYADAAPGYLRGRAFDSYTPGQWRDDAAEIILTPADDPSLAHDANEQLISGPIFQLAHRDSPRSTQAAETYRGTTGGRPRDRDFPAEEDGPSERIVTLEMWPNQPFSKVLFTPAGTTAVRAPVARLSVDVHGIFEAEQLSPGAAYAVWKRESVPQPLVDRQRLTELPDDLDPRVRELAKRVVAGADTDREKIAAVEQYFLSNYRYEFGIEIPPGQDALTYFLLQRPPAHCEYFASGAAVLLRAAGVPCRYVTGFVTAESNRYGGYWVARNRDAHAWAEAFDRERGWVLVEATPAVGVPQQTSASPARQLWDALRAGWQRFAAAFRQDAGRAVADAAKWLLLRPATAVLVTVAVALWLFRRFRRRHRRAAPIELDPLVVQLQALLRHMDRRWSQSGLKRPDHETLHQFAQRIESERAEPVCHRAAAWYRNFAAARYGRRLDEQTIHALREAQQQILGEAWR